MQEARSSGSGRILALNIHPWMLGQPHRIGKLEQALAYMEGNLDFMQAYLAQHLPQVKMRKPEGTYLAWLDFRGLGLNKDELEHLMFDEARVYLDEGYIFGPEGEGFERINIACPRGILVETMERVRRVVK